MSLSEPPLPFSDPEQGAQLLDTLAGVFGDLSLDTVRRALADASNPLRAALGLCRFLERSLSPRTQAELLSSSPRFAALLVTLFSQSRLLTDILCRNPEYAGWLWQEAELDNARPAHAIFADLWAAVGPCDGFERRMTALRRAARREVLRIAAREVFIHPHFSSIGEDISNLADAALEAAVRMAAEQLAPRYGAPLRTTAEGPTDRRAAFTVLGMGKLGGRELNFSSDIDLVFIYSDPGETSGGTAGAVTNEEYFKKLAELLIRALSETTADGFVFRVDARLRPFGASGPLAIAFDPALEYYMHYGRAWERQALIKARPCAGDLSLGEALLDKLRPFVFPRYFDDATLEDIRRVKEQAEARTAGRGETEREVKLGRGGIRDIEFTVQMLQLLNGGRFPELRTRNTLEAIRLLGERQRFSPLEAAAMARNYTFLREVEHRLQIEAGQQVHALPEHPEDLDEFARKLGYTDGAAFLRVYREHTADSRRILQKFLTVKGDGTLWVAELLERDADAGAGLEKLREMGFSEPEEVRRELLTLANGPGDAPHTRDVAAAFTAAAPALLDAFAGTPDPGRGLMRLAQIVERMRSPRTLYELLHYNPDLSRYLALLTANSEYLSTLLVRDVGLLEIVGSPRTIAAPSTRASLGEDLGALLAAAVPEAAPCRLRDAEMLKTALRELVLDVSVAEVGDELTLLAEVILGHALREAEEKTVERYGPAPAPFAILALGKFGGREMSYGSDLDLVFVYGDPETAPAPGSMSETEYFAQVASLTAKRLKEPTRHGVLYDVDARLRPDGGKGNIAIPLSRFVQYYAEEAHPWERFALMKARAVAGDPALRERLEDTARDAAFSGLPGLEALEQMDSLRAKAAAAASRRDLKRHEGGLSDVEFTTRLLQLRHAAEHPEVRCWGVFRALSVMKQSGLESAETCDALADAYNFLRRVMNRVRMMRGDAASSLPEDGAARGNLARRLGLEGELVDLVSIHRKRVAALYRDVHDAETRRARGDH